MKIEVSIRLIDEELRWGDIRTREIPEDVPNHNIILNAVKEVTRDVVFNLFPYGFGEIYNNEEWHEHGLSLTLACAGKRVILKPNDEGKMVEVKNESVKDRKFEIRASW